MHTEALAWPFPAKRIAADRCQSVGSERVGELRDDSFWRERRPALSHDIEHDTAILAMCDRQGHTVRTAAAWIAERNIRRSHDERQLVPVGHHSALDHRAIDEIGKIGAPFWLAIRRAQPLDRVQAPDR